jgi:hypothetical protein
MAALAGSPAYKDVQFFGIGYETNGRGARAAGSPAPPAGPFQIATDSGLVVADHFKAKVTPTVWVIDAKGIAVYTGAIDDNSDAAAVKSEYLKDALDAILANKTVEKPETPASGCTIRRRR